MRLIDADLLKKDLEDGVNAHANMPFDQYEWGAHAAYVDAIDLVDEQPIIVPFPEIIHCRECIRKDKCNFYPMQGDGGYCRYGKDKYGRHNPQE